MHIGYDLSKRRVPRHKYFRFSLVVDIDWQKRDPRYFPIRNDAFDHEHLKRYRSKRKLRTEEIPHGMPGDLADLLSIVPSFKGLQVFHLGSPAQSSVFNSKVTETVKNDFALVNFDAL